MKKIDNIMRNSLSGYEKLLHDTLKYSFKLFSFFLKNKWQKDNNFEYFHEDSKKYKRHEALYLLHKQFFITKIGTSKFFSENISGNISENKTQVDADTVSLLFLGDLIPYQSIDTHNIDKCFGYLESLVQDCDIIIANMESPLKYLGANIYSQRMLLGHINHSMNSNHFQKYQSLFPNDKEIVFSCANNHSIDDGVSGICNTLQLLQNNGFGTVGLRSNVGDDATHIVENQNVKFGFISFTYSLNHHKLPDTHSYMVNHIGLHERTIDLSSLIEEVQHLRNKGVNTIFLLLHMGNAYQRNPTMFIKNRVREILEKTGVECIICNHAHNLQPVETIDYICEGEIKQGIVAYALGDIVGDNALFSNKLSGALQIKVNKYSKSIVDMKLYPYITMRSHESLVLMSLYDVFTKNLIGNNQQFKDIQKYFEVILEEQ